MSKALERYRQYESERYKLFEQYYSDLSDSDQSIFQLYLDSDALTRLYIRHYITDSPKEKIWKKIKANVSNINT